jgi:acyl-coenzyme A thioesterase PaaI-like protein
VPESWRSRLARWGFNWFPAYRGTGARIEFIASDWKEVRVRLPLNWRTRNYVGTIFGGSLYGVVDPIYMIMLIKILGPDYVVWDKAATIRFKQPGRSTLRTHFVLTDAEIDAIRADVQRDGRTERTYLVELRDGDGNVCMSCEKLISIKAASIRRPICR